MNRTCKVCGGEDLRTVLNLGLQPFANDYRGEFGRMPLVVQACGECWHGQMMYDAEPADLFTDYPYVTGTSRTLRKYCRDFSLLVARDNDSGGNLLEIACNDGTQLAALQAAGFNVLGIDPAKNLESHQTGLPVLREFFTADYAHQMGKVFDVIVAQNVLAHVPKPRDLITGIALCLKPGGRAYVQTSQADWVKNAEFDCVYHEHFSYFHPGSLVKLIEWAGLACRSIEYVPIHGGSILATIQRPGPGERGVWGGAGFIRPAWETLQTNVNDRAAAAREMANNCRVGLGAAAKGTVFLNYTGIKLEAVLDENPNKQGLRMPGTEIPILDFESARDYPPGTSFLVLAWNFYDEIKAKLINLRPGCKDYLIRLFPFPQWEATSSDYREPR